MRYLIKTILIISLVLSSGLVLAAEDSLDVSVDVSSSCGNGVCEAAYGEDETSCPIDCAGAICNNNGVCESGRGETYENCPSDCQAPVSPGGGKDIAPPVVFNVKIGNITLDSADISWETDESAVCKFYWGRTYEYEEGAIAKESYSKKNSVKLEDLSSDAYYHFKIACQDFAGNGEETKDYSFKTLDDTPPQNIYNFTAAGGDKKTTLNWENPPDYDFEGVRIMRSTDFFPSNPWDGELVFEGMAASYVDENLENRVRYYYTAFSYDKDGNYSSGAVAWAVPQAPGEPPVYPPPPIEPPVEEPPPEIKDLSVGDFDFFQEGNKLSLFSGNTIKAKASKPLEVSIDYEKIPEVLKTIMVTLEKGDKFFSFLLRVNKEKTDYQANLLVPQEAGIYPVTIHVLDYKNKTLKKMEGSFTVEGGITPVPKEKPWQAYFKEFKWILYPLFLMLIALILRHFYKKYRNKKIKETPPLGVEEKQFP